MNKKNKFEELFPGVWRVRLGRPETITPQSVRKNMPAEKALAELADTEELPFTADDIKWKVAARGTYVEMPLGNDEELYGLGLQLYGFRHTGLKRQLRVNSDPLADTGDTHAPVPLWVSTKGYGVFVDTARYASVYCGSHQKVDELKVVESEKKLSATTTEELYEKRDISNKRVCVDIPTAQGVDVYIFVDPTMRQAVQRYNLFSGGGCLPAIWGLGMWYRPYGQATGEDVNKLADEFRQHNLPCDVMGLEPGWQTKVYSCSLVWDEDRFAADPEKFIKGLTDKGYKVNLWEHAFVHTSSPIFESLKSHSGPTSVWEGLVPDFIDSECAKIYSNYHTENFVKKGVTGFKLDECDNSDFIHSPWSFPEYDVYPSGADGEQMHCLLGLKYQDAIEASLAVENVRTYSLVRSSHALASQKPFVLYSDLYEHRSFIRGLVNSGFSGLLWTPEVRSSESVEDLIRRVQSVVFSPMALINAWYIKNPPWKQIDRNLNNADEFMDNATDVQALCRDLFELRMKLVPYLYAAFAKYAHTGLPPFRALVMDYPDDVNVYEIDDAYMTGDSLLVAPLVAGQQSRKVYLPFGDWYCFWTHTKYAGGQSYEIEPGLERIPVFVKDNSILPLADVHQCINEDTVFCLTVNVFGQPAEAFELFEDDGVSYDHVAGKYNTVKLTWDNSLATGNVERVGDYSAIRYTVVLWNKY